jgi:hypothetical protein
LAVRSVAWERAVLTPPQPLANKNHKKCDELDKKCDELVTEAFFRVEKAGRK